jgi:hypothetical protein
MRSGPTDNCATWWPKGGLLVALVTTDGKVYAVTGDYTSKKNGKLVPHMARRSSSPATSPRTGTAR